ncbi:hydantoinase/oxoprolinase family protein [Brevibacillus sp. NRS-1366]|uniref:hydantoinase/oxoprolinase family protein n=1 Tax=Brevibacillus sp. NRS-1366 TaxID=3233899 RepID=UPI003D201453
MTRSQDSNGAGTFVGVDIGGTFTDIVLRKPDGSVLVRKVSSTPEDPGLAILEGLLEVCQTEGIHSESIQEFIHGTTVATNTILEHKGAKTGLLTTKGFRDVLEIARIRTPSLFDLKWDKPKSLIERRYRLEVVERIDAKGEVITEIDQESVIAAIDKLVREGIESVAICFLHSYLNPEHEKVAERIVRERHPHLFVTCSYQVLPEMKEYERTSTTAVNAYILPKVNTYLNRLQHGLEEMQIKAPLLISASNGGVRSVHSAADYPVHIVASGPAAGVTGSAKLLEKMGITDAITFDMGGTTAKASLIEQGEPILTNEYEVREGISTPSRFIKAGGYLLKVAAVDIGEVGAGGGSIAWIDKGGALRIGPQSAGAAPGPVCYNLGGEDPTVTDANLVLGYLNPHHLAGGSLLVDRERAADAIRRKIAEPLGLSLEEAAFGIREVANANMTRAVRSVTIERGRDPRDFAMVAFGGNGGVHGADIAASLEIPTVIIPQLPGVFTAVGMLACDVRREFVSPVLGLLKDKLMQINETLTDLEEEGRAVLGNEGYTGTQAQIKFFADLRYFGQSSELTVPIELPLPIQVAGLEVIEQEFRKEYQKTYGYDTGEPVELVNLRLRAVGVRTNAPDLTSLTVMQPKIGKEKYVRTAYFGKKYGFMQTTVIDRADLMNTPVNGPLIVESYDSTIIVPPHASALSDRYGNIVIHVNATKEQSYEGPTDHVLEIAKEAN